jgi:predicted Zn-dependent protease
MMKNSLLLFFIICSFYLFLPACGTMSTLSHVSAKISGGKSGEIDQNRVNAKNNSKKAIASALEKITPEQEYFIGRAVAANILNSYRIYLNDAALNRYLNRICSTIVINSPKPEIYNGYHVMLLNSNEINAFATSGGHIFLTRGIISAANSEDALAAVIAHEIAHIQLRHSIKAIKTSRITQALLVTGVSAAGTVSGMDVNELTDVFNETVGEIITTMVNNGYSHAQEFAADAVAMTLLSASGYSPSGLIDMLKELVKQQNSRLGGFNSTHPAPDKRLIKAQTEIRKYRITDTGSYRKARFDQATGRR